MSVADKRQLPETARDLIAGLCLGAEVRLAAKSDLSPDGRFGEQWVALAGERILVCSLDDGKAEVRADLPLSDVAEVEIENLIGGGMLRAVVHGVRVDLVSFTNALGERFGRIRAQLDAAAKGKPIPEQEEKEKTCPTCGLVLGEHTRVCPRCARRGAALRRLLRYAQPYRGRLALIAALMLTGTSFGLVPPYLTKVLVDKVLIPRTSAPLLGWLVLGLAGSSLLSTGIEICRNRVTAWLGARVTFDIRAQLYERLQWLSMRYFDRHPTGAIISRLTQDSGGVQDVVAFGLPWLVANLITVVGVAVMVLIINWKLAVLALAPTPIIALLTRSLWERMHRAFHSFWYRWSRFNSLVSDALARVRVIKAFAQEPTEIARYQVRNRDLFGAAMHADRTWGTIFPLIWLIMGSGSLLVWYFGGLMRIADPRVTVGDLVAFLAYLGMLYGPLHFITQVTQWMSRALTAAERIFEVLDAESESEKTKGAVKLDPVKGEIAFRSVTFGYEKHRSILKEVSFEVSPGHMLGLVGKSGAGKTTIINLLCRFYDPDEGEVLVDGVNLKDISLWDYRARLGVVLQEPFLFAGTVAENIAYGRPDASLEDIMAAAKTANAHDFIVNKPDGYDEQVGERGGRLSAGEKQRICIARAILHNPAILILDEATANVDLETEEQIQQAIARLIEGRTTFAIAHRLSTLRNADRLLVIEDGKVVEFGQHQELEANKGLYYQLLDLHRKTSLVTGIDG